MHMISFVLCTLALLLTTRENALADALRNTATLDNRAVLNAPARMSQVVARFTMDSSGYIRQAGELVGKFDRNGYVRDRHDQILGRIDAIGYVRDRHDQILGRMDVIGYVRDRHDQILARYSQGGDLRDKNGNIIAINMPGQTLALVIVFFRL